jgi:hypothetical protein
MQSGKSLKGLKTSERPKRELIEVLSRPTNFSYGNCHESGQITQYQYIIARQWEHIDQLLFREKAAETIVQSPPRDDCDDSLYIIYLKIAETTTLSQSHFGNTKALLDILLIKTILSRGATKSMLRNLRIATLPAQNSGSSEHI